MRYTPPDHPPRRGRRRWRGFTLVELLVVISIIAVLIGILLPALAATRGSAVRVQCQSHLRSVHQMLHSYAMEEDGVLPLGYRGGRLQWNTMVYSGSGAGKFVLFGKMYLAGLMDNPQVFYCPAETALDQGFNTADNPWPPGTPGTDVQGGYASYPFVDWAFLVDPPRYPSLDELETGQPLLADGVGLPARVDSRHITGVHVLYADSAVRWAARERFDAALSQCVGLAPANNPYQQQIWDELAVR